MNAKRQLAILLVTACAVWAQASAAQNPARSAAPAAKPKATAPAAAKKPAAKSAPATAAAKPAGPSGKRDPFVSLAVVRAQQVGAQCGTGKRCLVDRKSTRLNSSHIQKSRMPSSA